MCLIEGTSGDIRLKMMKRRPVRSSANCYMTVNKWFMQRNECQDIPLSALISITSENEHYIYSLFENLNNQSIYLFRSTRKGHFLSRRPGSRSSNPCEVCLCTFGTKIIRKTFILGILIICLRFVLHFVVYCVCVGGSEKPVRHTFTPRNLQLSLQIC